MGRAESDGIRARSRIVRKRAVHPQLGRRRLDVGHPLPASGSVPPAVASRAGRRRCDWTSDLSACLDRDRGCVPFPTRSVAMKVRDWMSAEVITVTPKTGLSDAWELMRRRRIRHLLVMERQRLLGIISDRDIRLA